MLARLLGECFSKYEAKLIYTREKSYYTVYSENSPFSLGLHYYQGAVAESWADDSGWTDRQVTWSDTDCSFRQFDSNGNDTGVEPYWFPSLDDNGGYSHLPDEDLWAYGSYPWPPPILIYHYYADNVHWTGSKVWGQTLSDFGFSDTDEAVKAARTTVTLLTGGKSGVNRKSLWCIQPWATAYGRPWHSSGIAGGAGWFDAPGTDVPKTKLWVLKKQVGADGKLWVALPDNSAQNITVTAQGVKHYDAGPVDMTDMSRVQKYRLRIRANNAILEAKTIAPNANFCVGQKVNFSIDWLPGEPPGIQQTSPIWNYTADYVNEHWTDENGCEQYNINPILAMSNPTVAWFYNKQTQDAMAYLGLGCKFNNGQSVHLIGQGKFNVYCPIAAPWTDQNGIWYLDPRNATLHEHSLFSTLTLDSADMHYGVGVTSTFSGKANYVQLISSQDYGDYYPYAIDTGGQYVLDNSNPYNGVNTVISANMRTAVALQDGPSMNGLYTIAINDACKDYLVFRPDVGNPGDNIWITLGRIEWSWMAGAWRYTGDSNWNINSYCPPPTYHQDNTFPYYQNTVHNGLPYP